MAFFWSLVLNLCSDNILPLCHCNHLLWSQSSSRNYSDEYIADFKLFLLQMCFYQLESWDLNCCELFCLFCDVQCHLWQNVENTWIAASSVAYGNVSPFHLEYQISLTNCNMKSRVSHAEHRSMKSATRFQFPVSYQSVPTEVISAISSSFQSATSQLLVM